MPVWKFFCSKKRCSNLLFILIIRQKDKDRSSALVESFLGKEELRKVILFHIDNRVKVRTKAWWNSFKLCRELHFNFIYIDILLASLFFPSSDIKGNTKHYTEYKYKKLCKDLGNTRCLQYKVNCSVIKSRLTLWDPMDYSVPGLPVPQCLGVFSSSCPLSRWCYPTPILTAVFKNDSFLLLSLYKAYNLDFMKPYFPFLPFLPSLPSFRPSFLLSLIVC